MDAEKTKKLWGMNEHRQQGDFESLVTKIRSDTQIDNKMIYKSLLIILNKENTLKLC
jgi:hypothetical protein